MKNSKRTFSGAGQSTTEVKKSQKHDANLQKNSTLYFQVGLILALLATYGLFEMQFEEKIINFSDETATVEPVTLDYVKPYIVEVIKPKEVQSQPSTDLKDILKVVENDEPVIEKIINTPDAPKTTPELVDIGDIVTIEKPEEPVFVPFSVIENVPVYPGCEKYKANDDRKKCMSKKINKLIGKKFNSYIAADYGITGKQTIHTQFTVDKNGNVIDIKVRAPHPALEQEAKRVINKIPHMKPGYQRDTPVGVVYNLPIKFDARN